MKVRNEKPQLNQRNSQVSERNGGAKIAMLLYSQEHIRMVSTVRVCNTVKFETGQNLPPVLICTVCAV